MNRLSLRHLTYVTVIVQPRRGPVRILMCNARGTRNAEFFVTVPGLVDSNWTGPPKYRYCDEGITWARGWDTTDARALRAAEALR